DPDRKEAAAIVEQLFEPAAAEQASQLHNALLSSLLPAQEVSAATEPRLHLPFLQIYLQAHYEAYGAACTEHSIREMGDLNAVLQQHLRDLNDRIMNRIGKPDTDLPQEYPVVKLLKSFVSPVTDRAFRVSADELAAQAWPFQHQTPDGQVLTDLLVAEGVLIERGGYYQLTHPSLAGPISEFSIREDLLKKDFETSFQIWHQTQEMMESKLEENGGWWAQFRHMMGLATPVSLLSRGQVFSMKPYIEYILGTGDESLADKRAFWTRSKKNERKWRRRRNVILVVFALLASAFAVLSYVTKEQIDQRLTVQKQNTRLQKAGKTTSQVYKGTGEAWKAYHNDRTSAF
ncbi:MAG: hypothetical protein R3330_19570, partial [Saprospiraceae bacterium]|nr:hypothetical protein [Saprospiraceae bacterium]